MQIGALQMNVVLADREANLKTAERMIGRAMAEAGAWRKPDVLVLPELWDLGFVAPNVLDLGDEDGRIAREFLGGQAKQYGVNIVGGSISRRQGGKLWNTTYVFDRQGSLVAKYDKIHLYNPGDEGRYFQPGDALVLCDLDGVRAGFMICYDLRFPELSRSLALAGARILFNCTAWPHPKTHHWRTLCQARAIENQVYLAGVNCVGVANELVLCGHSMLVNPWGEIMAEAGEEEAILYASCDFAHQETLRGNMPVFDDRRPGVYTLG